MWEGKLTRSRAKAERLLRAKYDKDSGLVATRHFLPNLGFAVIEETDAA